MLKRPDDQFNNQNAYQVIAEQRRTILKAKLFLGHNQVSEEGQFLQSGDCIRLKQCEADGYLTTSSVEVDNLLPMRPDFLLGQIRRMYQGLKIERPKGGLDKLEIHGNENLYLKND